MRIKKILYQHRRDFRAVYVCPFCGYEKEGSGYDDAYFHHNVIPEMKCDKCGKTEKDGRLINRVQRNIRKVSRYKKAAYQQELVNGKGKEYISCLF